MVGWEKSGGMACHGERARASKEMDGGLFPEVPLPATACPLLPLISRLFGSHHSPFILLHSSVSFSRSFIPGVTFLLSLPPSLYSIHVGHRMKHAHVE